MLFEVARFELCQQVRSHVFWVVVAISGLMVFGSVSVDELRVGLGHEGLRNGAAAIVQMHLVWSLFFMFTTAALVADAVLRDDLTGFGPIIRATPVPRPAYVLGRFVGAFGAVLLCFIVVPLAMALGAHAPWVDPASVGPLRWSAYLFSLLVLAVPNLVVSASLGFGLVSVSGSMMGALLGAVALLVAYGLGSSAAGMGSALLEPFGFLAYQSAVATWPMADRDTAVPWLDPALLVNRAVWLTLGMGLLAYTCRRLDADRRPVSLKEEADQRVPIPVRAPPAPASRSSGPRTVLAQVVARTRLDLQQVVVTPAFGILLLLGIVNTAAALWTGEGLRSGAATGDVIVILIRSFQVVPIVVAGFFAGELLWNERERRVHDLVGAMPMPDAAFVLPKLLALAITLALLAVGTALTGVVVQQLRGEAGHIDLVAYVTLYVVPTGFDWVLFATLALALQAVSPNKLAGWGWTVVYLIGALALQKLGLVGPRYRYGLYPGWPLPASLSGAADVAWYRIYWGAAASVLAVLACSLFGRGTPGRLLQRLRRLPGRLRGVAGLVAVIGAGVFVATLVFLIGTGR